MKIGILTQWYAPEPGPAALPASLAEELASRGHEVRVLTGFPNYPEGRIADGYEQSRRSDEVRNGVLVRRVALYPSHDDSAIRRILNYGSFAASAWASGLDFLDDVDVLWVNYSPVTVSLPMFAIHRRRGTPLVVHVLDLWPDTVTASGLGGGLGGRADKVLGVLCDRIYAAASTVAFISPGVERVLAERGVPREKLAYAPMWADESVHQFVPPAEDRGWGVAADTTVLAYAGTLGGAQDLDTLIKACSRVVDLDLVCLIAGSGTDEQRLRALAESEGATNITFVGRLDADGMQRLNGTSDIHYAGLNDHPLAGVTMPSKVQAILAAGRPVLGALSGDAARVVAAAGGRAVLPGEDEKLASHLRELAGAGRKELGKSGLRARAYYEQQFSLQRGVSTIESLLLEAAGGSGPGIRVRPLQRRDVARCAELHVHAFPGFFLSQLGERFLSEFYKGFLGDPTAIALVAVDDRDVVVGSVVGSREPAGFFSRLLKRRLFGFALASALVTLRRPTAAPRLLRAVLYRGQIPLDVSGALLSSICVDPETQSGGVGSRLIGAFAREVQEHGLGAHLLTDRDDNAAANAFYVKNGWTLAGSYETDEGRGMNCYILPGEKHE